MPKEFVLTEVQTLRHLTLMTTLDEMTVYDIKAKFPEYGNRIPGSRFYRAYCPRCHTPMRVTESKIKTPSTLPWCDDCGGHGPLDAHVAHLSERQRARIAHHTS